MNRKKNYLKKITRTWYQVCFWLFIIPAFVDRNIYLCQTVMRNSNEGTMLLKATNVLGNGAIVGSTTAQAILSNSELLIENHVSAAIGIAQLMEFEGSLSLVNGKTLGPVETHLKVTLPNNEKLRFFGVAGSVDLYLSTSIDTIGTSSDSSKPEFTPYPRVSAMVDLDWIVLNHSIPLKSYACVSMVSRPKLLYAYYQINVNSGLEWKGLRHSLFVDGAIAWYKSKQKNIISIKGYDNYYSYISPGFRYRFVGIGSVVGALDITVGQSTLSDKLFSPPLYAAHIRAEIPLFFKESHSEAIRTLIFEENKNYRLSKNMKKALHKTEKSLSGNPLLEIDSININISDSQKDIEQEKKDIIQQREEIEDKMRKIEELLLQ